MSAYAKMLLEKRANTWEQAKALLDAALAEKRELTADEQQSYDRMTAELDETRALADKLEADARMAKDTEESLRALADAPTEHRGAPARDLNTELRSFLKGDRRSIDITPTADEVRGVQAMLETRALGPSSAGAGAATMPTNFYNRLWAHLINTSQILQSGITVLQTDNGNTINLPTTTAHSTAAWVDAGTIIPESDPVFAQRSLSAYKAGVLISVDQELLDDTGVDLEGYLSMQAGRAVGNLVGEAIVAGDGTAKPTGITTLTTLGVTGGTGVAGVPTADDVINLYYSVIPQYRAASSAAFVINDASIGYLRTLKDSVGQYLWQPSLVAGTPDTLMGKKVVSEVWMPATATGAKSILFGDLSAYFARIVNGIRFEQSRDFAFNTDQITFRCLLRADGTLVDRTGAVKHFAGAAS